MSQLVTINSITSGESPYDIWICDSCIGTCIYQTTISTTPYSFTLPEIYETYPTFVIKIIDDNGCSYCETGSTVYKQFQIGDFFEFQNNDMYDFQ